MNGKFLSEQLSYLPEDMVEEAMRPAKKLQYKNTAVRVLRAAACFAVVVGLLTAVLGLYRSGDGIVTRPGLLAVTAYAADGEPFTTSSADAVVPFTHYWGGAVSWSPGCPITLSVTDEAYQSDNITFQVTVNGGGFLIGASGHPGIYPVFFDYLPAQFSVPNHTAIFWSNFYDAKSGDYVVFKGDASCIEITIYDGSHIIGYAVLCFRNMTYAEFLDVNPDMKEHYEEQGYQEDQLTNLFRLEILDSVFFPKVDGEYQDITQGYVNTCIENVINTQ